jgi:hypothetical protein
MPKLINRNPKYRKHRASGQAIVTIGRQDRYLGPYGTAASRREYDRVIAEWLAHGRSGLAPTAAVDLAVIELIAAYWRHARSYYASPADGPDAGDSNGELSCLRLALAVVKRLYADTSVSEFGPLAQKAVRAEMVKRGWARSHVNPQIGRVRRMFR